MQLVDDVHDEQIVGQDWQMLVSLYIFEGHVNMHM